MKQTKRIMYSGIGAFAMCSLIFFIYLMYYKSADKMLFCIRQRDGSRICEHGLGCKVVRILDDMGVQKSCTGAGTGVLDFALAVLLFAAVIFAVSAVIDKKRSKA